MHFAEDLALIILFQRNHGWRTAKRPGVDYFLGYLSQFYEIVIFTTQPSYVCPFLPFVGERTHVYRLLNLFSPNLTNTVSSSLTAFIARLRVLSTVPLSRSVEACVWIVLYSDYRRIFRISTETSQRSLSSTQIQTTSAIPTMQSSSPNGRETRMTGASSP